MVVAIDPNEPFDYVCKADRGLDESDPNRTVFKLRPLTRKQRAATEDIVRGDPATGEVVPMVGQIKSAVLAVGLMGWSNFRGRCLECTPDTRDGCGTCQGVGTVEIPFKRMGKQLNILGSQIDPPREKCLERIPPYVEAELANAITEGNRLTVEEGKGSSSLPPSPSTDDTDEP